MPEELTTPATDEITTPPKAETVDMAGLMARIEELESAVTQQKNRAEEAEEVLAHVKAEADSLRFERKLGDRITQLQRRAQSLFQAGKVEPVVLNEWFPSSESPSDAVVRFAKAIQAEDATKDPLDDIESKVDYIEKYGKPIVKFGSAIGGQPIGDNPYREPELTDEEKAQTAEVVKAAKARRYY